MALHDAKSTSHAIDHALVDRLVREVMRRLTAISDDETTTLGDKVITAATIENIPEIQKRLSVRPGTVVTPAARDEARRRNITIEHAPNTTTRTQSNDATDPSSGICDAVEPERATALTVQLLRRGVKLPRTKIMLSETPARDVYEQCSGHRQRGVMVTALADVDRFDAELTPTCWVLDMTRLNFVAATNVAARIAMLER